MITIFGGISFGCFIMVIQSQRVSIECITRHNIDSIKSNKMITDIIN
nr:MAG TPA: hypothetical protein [Caudoviricetes sp.]